MFTRIASDVMPHSPPIKSAVPILWLGATRAPDHTAADVPASKTVPAQITRAHGHGCPSVPVGTTDSSASWHPPKQNIVSIHVPSATAARAASVRRLSIRSGCWRRTSYYNYILAGRAREITVQIFGGKFAGRAVVRSACGQSAEADKITDSGPTVMALPTAPYPILPADTARDLIGQVHSLRGAKRGAPPLYSLSHLVAPQ